MLSCDNPILYLYSIYHFHIILLKKIDLYIPSLIYLNLSKTMKQILFNKIYHSNSILPIAVGLIPVIKDNKEGILLISKTNDLHLPSGIINRGKSWEESFNRSMETMDMKMYPDEFSFYCLNSSPYSPYIHIYALSNQIRNLDNGSDYLVGLPKTKLLLSLHQQVYDWVWCMKKDNKSFMESHRIIYRE